MKKNFFKPRKLFILSIFLFGFLFITNGVPYIYSDGFASYHTAYAIVNEHSFVTKAKPEYYDYRGHVIDFKDNQYSTVYSPGTALFNVPGIYIATHLFKHKTDTIYTNYFMALNGHTLAEGVAYLITAMLIALLTLYFLYQALRQIGFSEKTSLFATASAYISSYAIWYVFLVPAFNHTYELFGVVFAIWSFAKFRKTNKNKYSALTGVGVGIATICRPVLLVVGIPIGIYLLLKKRYKALISYIAGGVPLALLMMRYNLVSYGKLIASGYSENRGENFDFSHFNGLKILFSQYRGWFTYSPIFLVAIIGLIILYRKAKFWSLFSLFSIVSLVIIYGFWPAWWGGGSYGQRFLIPLMPFGAIGLAALVSYVLHNRRDVINQVSTKNIAVAMVFICTLWSLLLTIMYRFTPVAELRPRTDSVGRMLSGNRYTPVDIIKYQVQLVKNSNNIPNYFTTLFNNMSGGNSFVPLLLGRNNAVLRIDERTPNVLKFILLNPPIIKQKIPNEISFYLDDQKSENIYLVTFKNFDKQSTFELDCFVRCISTNGDIYINTQNNFPKTLPKDKYTGLKLDNFEMKLFFPNYENMFFRGTSITLPDGVYEYNL